MRAVSNIHFDDPILKREFPLPLDEPVHDVAGHLWRLLVQLEESTVVV